MNKIFFLIEKLKTFENAEIEEILKELEDYSIPEKEMEKYKAVTDKADMFDYDGIVEIHRTM